MADYEYDDDFDSPPRNNQQELKSSKQNVEINKKQTTGTKDKKDLELDIDDNYNKLKTAINKGGNKPQPQDQKNSPGKDDYDDDFDVDEPKPKRNLKDSSPNETQDLTNQKGEPKNFADKPISMPAKNDMVSPQYQKLKDQNRKLKEELKELAKAADEALQRERQNKTAKRNKEEDPELKEKMQELKEQLAKIDQLKHQTTIMKRQLQNTYNLPKVVEKEDELKAAKKELARVTEEKNSLLKIKKEQNKALDFLNNEGEYDKRLKQVTQELRQLKEDYKKENELYIENEKAMKKLHEKIISMEEKSRDLQKKVKEKKGDKIKAQGNPDYKINEENMNALETKIKDFQDKKAAVERNFDEEMRALDKKKKALGLENEKLATQVKEKEKEIRLNNLRLKELKKLTRYNAVKPLENQKETVTTTMNRASSRESQEDDKSNFVTQTRSDASSKVQKKPLQRVDNSHETKKTNNQKPKPKDEEDNEKFEEEEIDYEEPGQIQDDDELPSKAFSKPTVKK